MLEKVRGSGHRRVRGGDGTIQNIFEKLSLICQKWSHELKNAFPGVLGRLLFYGNKKLPEKMHIFLKKILV